MGRDFNVSYLLQDLTISIHSPRMGRDRTKGNRTLVLYISIHSPRMGRDNALPPFVKYYTNFNPLSPHGERRKFVPIRPVQGDFNPLSPHGERLPSSDCNPLSRQFQSTLPAWGETGMPAEIWPGPWNFNPLSPHGERRMGVWRMRIICGIFQSTLPAWGETANAHNFSKRKTGASAQHCIFSPAKRFFLLTKNFLEKRNKPFFRCEPYRKTVGAPVSHQPLKN